MTQMLAPFEPYAVLAAKLRPWLSDVGDGSHDLAHILRVWRFARRIQSNEGGSLSIIFVASFLHDCVHLEKDDGNRRIAARWSALRAAKALRCEGWSDERIAAVCHAIEAHSFTAGVAPRTLEARILHDADRLDSAGLMGIARCFYVAGRIGSALYDVADPMARRRDVDDMQYALDHFQSRLLTDPEALYTPTARDIARERRPFVLQFREQFLNELGETGKAHPIDQDHSGADGDSRSMARAEESGRYGD